MIITEYYMTRKDDVELYRTYSDIGLKIRKVGTEEIYDEAIDVVGSLYTYEETEILIKHDENNTPSNSHDEISPEEFMSLIEEAL